MRMNPKMRKRLLIVATIAVLAVGSVGGLWVHRKYATRQEYAGYRAQGLQLAQSADPAAPEAQEALELLSKYIRRTPGDVEVLKAYAKLRQQVELPRSQHLLESMKILQHLLRVDPSQTEARRELLRLYARTGFNTEALELSGQVLLDTPDDAEAAGFKAQALQRLRREPDALEAARRWAELAPHELDAHILTLWLMSQVERNPAAMVAYARNLVATYPDDAKFETLLGFAHMQIGQPAEAEKVLRQAAARAPTDPSVVLELVDKLDRVGLLNESLVLLRQAASPSVGDETEADVRAREDVRQLLLRRLWQAGQHGEVVQLIEQRTATMSHLRLEQQAMKAVSLSALGRADDARAVISDLAAEEGDSAAAWALVPEYMLGIKRDQAASQAVRDACLRVVEVQRGSPYLRQCLAEAYLQLGEQDLAISLYRDLVAENPSWTGSLMRLSDLLVQRGRTGEALEMAYLSLSRAPSNPVVAGGMARVWEIAINQQLRNDTEPLFELAKQVQGIWPGEEQSLPVYIRLMLQRGEAQGRLAEARGEAQQALKAALASDPRPSQAALLAWAQLSRAHDLGLDQQCLRMSEEHYGLSVGVAFSRAAALHAAGKTDEGKSLLAAARSNAKPTPEADVSWRLAEVRYLDLTRAPGRHAAWQALADELSQNLVVQQAAVETDAARGDPAFALRVIDRIRSLAGEQSTSWRLAKARLLLAEGPDANSGEAAILLNEALRFSPESVEARLLLAQSLDREGHTPKAIEHLTAAARLDPASQTVTLFLVHLLQKSGDFAQARLHLDRLGQGERLDPEQRRRAAAVLAQQGDTAEAAELLASAHGRTREEELMLAQLYLGLGRLSEAQQVIEPLMQSPDLGAVALAADLYGRMGKPQEAASALQQLETLPVDAGTRALIRAGFEERYGEPETAIQLLRQGTAAAPQNAAAWRALASVLLQQGQVAEALATLQEGVQRAPDDPALRAAYERRGLIETAAAKGLGSLAMVLLQTPGDSALAEATDALSRIDLERTSATLVQLRQLATRHAGSLPVQLAVAQTYLALQRPADAAEVAERAAQAFPRAAEPAKQATLALARDGKWEQALHAARIWRERAGSAGAEANLVMADCHEALGQDDEALQRLEVLVSGTDGAAASPDLVARYAALLYRSGGKAQAEALVAGRLAGDARWIEAWLRAVITKLPPQEAAQQVDKYRDQLTDTEGSLFLAQADDALATRLDEPQRAVAANQQYEAMEKQLLAGQGAGAQALILLASRHEHLQAPERAAKLYRLAIERGDPTGIASNNLAMILLQSGDVAGALHLAEAAAQQHARIPAYSDTLATVQQKRGDLAAAIAAQKRAVAAAPGEVKWRIALADLLLQAGQRDDAGRALDDLQAVAGSASLDDVLRARVLKLRSKLAGGEGLTPGS